MTTIHDQLNDAVADVRPDLDALAFTARKQGLAKRRLARSLTAVGTVAAVSVMAVGGWALTGLGDSPRQGEVAPAAGPTTAPAPPSAPVAPSTQRLTGRTTAVLLDDLVKAVAPAGSTTSDFKGQGGVDLLDEGGNVSLSASDFPLTYAELVASSSRGTSTVGVNVQPLRMAEGDACSAEYAGTECEVTTLPNGDKVRTYVDTDSKPDATRLVAELLSSSRDLRVVVGASAPNGAAQALTRAELVTIASDSSWSFQVPGELVARGEALEGFTALDSDTSIDGMPRAPREQD